MRRLAQVGQTPAVRREQASTDAAGKAYLIARLNFESVMDTNAVTLSDAGRPAAAPIGDPLNHGAAEFVAANPALARKAPRCVPLLAGFALVAGAVGALCSAGAPRGRGR